MSSIEENERTEWIISRYIVLHRNLGLNDTRKLQVLIREYFPSVNSFKHHKSEIINLLQNNLKEPDKKILTRTQELAVGNTTPSEEDRRIKRDGNRLKHHLKFLYKKLQDIVYNDAGNLYDSSSEPSRESSREQSSPNPHQPQHDISMAAFDHMKNSYEVRIRELENRIQELQTCARTQSQGSHGSQSQDSQQSEESINTENAEEHGLEVIHIGSNEYFMNPANDYVYSKEGTLLGTKNEMERRILDQRPIDLDIFNFFNDPVPEIDDLAETHPSTTETLLPVLEPFKGRNILDPCAGKNMMANVLRSHGHTMISRDLFTFEERHDFLTDPLPEDIGFIVAHPPFTMKRAFLERCFALKLPFALLVPLLSVATEPIGELLHNNGCEIRILIGPQQFYHENELKPGGYCAWIIGNIPGSNNLIHTYLVGHDWQDPVPRIRASSFDETNDLVAEMKAMDIVDVPDKEQEQEPTKCTVLEDIQETCPICWDVLNDETYRIGENCAHPLCVYCWVEYTNRGANKCPICRQLLKNKRGRGRPRRIR